jgi:hypothetical protein
MSTWVQNWELLMVKGKNKMNKNIIMITEELGVRTIGSVVHVHEYIISICLMSHGWSEKVCTFNKKCEMRDKL